MLVKQKKKQIDLDRRDVEKILDVMMSGENIILENIDLSKDVSHLWYKEGRKTTEQPANAGHRENYH